jgi:hypothetical protein
MSQGSNPPPNPLPIPMGGTGNAVGPSLPSSTVVGLPAASTRSGQMFMVTDALAPALGVAVAGGGAVTVIAVSNGTNWIAV